MILGERFWTGLQIRTNVTSNSELSNALVADAGGTSEALLLQADVNVDAVQVRNSGGIGVVASDFRPGSAGLTVEGALGAAVELL